MAKKKLVTGPELASMRKPKPASKQAVHKSKSIPYEKIDGIRHYNINDPLIKKWLKGESIAKHGRPAKKKPVNKTVKKSTAKKKTSKKDAKKTPTKKGTARKINEVEEWSGIEIPEHLKELSDSGQLTFAAAMGLTKSELQKIEIYEKIKKTKVEADQKRDTVVDKKLVRTVFSKLYEIDMNQFIPMKEKLIPDLSAIYGNDDDAIRAKAAERIDRELWKILANVKRELNKFLKKVNEKEIE